MLRVSTAELVDGSPPEILRGFVDRGPERAIVVRSPQFGVLVCMRLALRGVSLSVMRMPSSELRLRGSIGGDLTCTRSRKSPSLRESVIFFVFFDITTAFACRHTIVRRSHRATS